MRGRRSDPDAVYAGVKEYDVSRIEPQVAFPHSPGNTRPVSQAGDIAIDQAVIGSCTNGRIEDLRVAARVLKGNKVKKYVRTIIIPATQAIYRQAMQEGLLEVFDRSRHRLRRDPGYLRREALRRKTYSAFHAGPSEGRRPDATRGKKARARGLRGTVGKSLSSLREPA